MGDFFVPADAGGWHCGRFLNGVFYYAPVYEIAKKYIKVGTITLDRGSNLGQVTIMMSRHVGEQGMVHAFEADDFIFRILENNIQQNAAKVVPQYGAVLTIRAVIHCTSLSKILSDFRPTVPMALTLKMAKADQCPR